MKTKIALALLLGGVATTGVLAQNKLKVAYKEHEHQYALVKEGVDLEDVNEMTLDLISPLQNWRSIETRVNLNYQLEYTYVLDSTTYQKSYSQLPKRIDFFPAGFSIYDAENTLLESDTLGAASEAAAGELAVAIAEYGYHPGLPNFSRISLETLLQLSGEGYLIDTSQANQLSLTDPLGRQTIYDYSLGYIYDLFEDAFQKHENLKMYEYVNGVGFLPYRDITHTVDKELDTNVTFVNDRVFSDFQITDFAGILQSTNTIQNEHIRLYPVPIQENLNLELINMPNDVIRSITIRDFQGNPVLTILGNDAANQVLPTYNFPSGLLHIEVTTNGGLYTRQSFKN